MKKKFTGALVALLGSAAAVGAAFALYVSHPENKEINIGTKTAGDVILNLAVTDGDAAHAALSPDNLTRTIILKAGFTTNEDSVYIQDYFLAKVEFKISSASSAVVNALKDHSWIKLGTQTGDHAYGDYWKDKILNGSDKHVADDGLSVSWYEHYPIAKGTQTTQFEFRVQLNNTLTQEQMLAVSELGYNVDVQIGDADSDYGMAYVVGDACGGWEQRDEFRMVPNAKAASYEWMFKTGTVAGKSMLLGGKDFKLINGGSWCHGEGNHTWNSEDNGKLIIWVANEYSDITITNA